MTSAHPEILRPGAEIFHPTGATGLKANRGGIVRFVVVALAVLALVALGALDPRPTTSESAASDAASLAEPSPTPAFDGRGKWGGYAR